MTGHYIDMLQALVEMEINASHVQKFKKQGNDD